MPDRSTYADPSAERFWTGATVITLIRTVAALVLCLIGVGREELTWLVVGLGVYWAGDSLDGAWARWFDCETRIGAVVDMLCDRLNCAAFYLGFAALQHEMLLPVSVYLFEFLVIDFFLSLAFLAWPIRSPNYFYEVDRRIYLWNWSKPAKAVNSSLFAVLLLVTGWWWLGLAIAIGLVVFKCISLRWLLQLGLPVPARLPQTAG
ncbi:CDP-alcohol phosphatidyltransferase family protein [Nocardioides sp. GXZ039]|uniref:CDP-alcohol phosphatidyltransferase family protein n=1 Tax=Nocardioides sp. GXZ039 TaxID=3136018 RepID=UPI0030F46542